MAILQIERPRPKASNITLVRWWWWDCSSGSGCQVHQPRVPNHQDPLFWSCYNPSLNVKAQHIARVHLLGTPLNCFRKHWVPSKTHMSCQIHLWGGHWSCCDWRTKTWDSSSRQRLERLRWDDFPRDLLTQPRVQGRKRHGGQLTKSYKVFFVFVSISRCFVKATNLLWPK